MTWWYILVALFVTVILIAYVPFTPFRVALYSIGVLLMVIGVEEIERRCKRV